MKLNDMETKVMLAMPVAAALEAEPGDFSQESSTYALWTLLENLNGCNLALVHLAVETLAAKGLVEIEDGPATRARGWRRTTIVRYTEAGLDLLRSARVAT